MTRFSTFLNEAAIVLALIVTVAAIGVVTIVSGADSLGSTGLRDLAILLGGALAGTKMPKR